MSVLAAMLIVAAAIQLLAAEYFMTLVEKFHIDPQEAHSMFLEAVHRYLFGAALLACLLAFGLSIWLTRRILTPLRSMQESAAIVARGDYSVRVQAQSHDEIGELAIAFNRMADSLLQAEASRKQMVADVAHELRSPLTNFRGYLEGLIEGVIPPSPDVFESLHEETLRLVDLVEDVLQLARVDAGEMKLRREELDLAMLIEQTIELFRLRSSSRGMSVSFQPSEDLKPVIADSDRIVQVLTNLMENAWRYGVTGTEVTIATQQHRDAARVIVANDAEPMRDQEVAHVFDRFFRIEKSRSREYGGAGIGLAIVKDLIEAHGGTVGSRLVAGRFEVWFELPAVRN